MIIGAFLIGVGMVWWYSICTDITYAQRLRVIQRTYHHPKEFTMGALSNVTEDAHFWRVLTLRDPEPLYDEYRIATPVETLGL